MYILDFISFSKFDAMHPCSGVFSKHRYFIVEKISKEAKDGAPVSIETSIPKGTSKKVLEMLKCRLHVAYAPHITLGRKSSIIM